MTVAALGGHKRIWVCGVIDDAPTIDSQPVKHGKWIADNADLPSKNYTCSECMNKIQTKYYCWQCYIRYCDNCGAKMDKGDNDGSYC